MPLISTHHLNPYLAIILCAVSLSILGCKAQDESAETAAAEVVSTTPSLMNETVLNAETGLTISNAYIKPPLPGRDISTIYFTLLNGTQADQLIGVRTSLSDHAEIHTHIKDGDIMKMRRIEMLNLKSGESVPFKPGGYHIMVFGTELSPVATDGEITLIFDNAGEATLTLPIQGRTRDLYKSSDEPTQNTSSNKEAEDKPHH